MKYDWKKTTMMLAKEFGEPKPLADVSYRIFTEGWKRINNRIHANIEWMEGRMMTEAEIVEEDARWKAENPGWEELHVIHVESGEHVSAAFWKGNAVAKIDWRKFWGWKPLSGIPYES